MAFCKFSWFRIADVVHSKCFCYRMPVWFISWFTVLPILWYFNNLMAAVVRIWWGVSVNETITWRLNSKKHWTSWTLTAAPVEIPDHLAIVLLCQLKKMLAFILMMNRQVTSSSCTENLHNNLLCSEKHEPVQWHSRCLRYCMYIVL